MTQTELAEKGLTRKGHGSWSGDNKLKRLVIPDAQIAISPGQ